MLKIHFKAKFTASIKREGFFPRGGGHVFVEPGGVGGQQSLHPIDLIERGKIEKVECYIKFIGDVWHGKEGRNSMSAQKKLIQSIVIDKLQHILPKNHPLKFYYTQSEMSKGGKPSTGLEIQLIASSTNNCILGGNALVNSKSLATIGKEAALAASNNLAKELKSEACVSEHLADQLLVFMALAKGTSRIRIRPILSFTSKHLETGIYVIKELMKDVQIRVYPNPIDEGETQIVECKGIGLTKK